MAAGDVKDVDKVVIRKLLAGATITKGQLVHEETDDYKWDPAADNDKGPFAVALEAATDTTEFRAVLWGPVEVTYAGGTALGTAAAKLGDALGAQGAQGGSVGQVCLADAGAFGEKAGIAYENMDTSGNTYTMFVGLGTY